MRTLLEIVEDIKDGKKPDYEELRYAVLVYSWIFSIEHNNYIEVLLSEKEIPKHVKKLKADSSFAMYKTALNTSPKEYLGWRNDPDNPEYQKFRKKGNKFLDMVMRECKGSGQGV